MFWFRIDNRLIHGQVIEGWLPYLDTKKLVVFNDDLAGNGIQQEILMLAVPDRVDVRFEPLRNGQKVYERLKKKGVNTLCLVATCQDAAKLVMNGVPMAVLNVGNLHYSQGKRQLCGHVSVSDMDLRCLQNFVSSGVQLDFRCVPTDVPQMEQGVLELLLSRPNNEKGGWMR